MDLATTYQYHGPLQVVDRLVYFDLIRATSAWCRWVVRSDRIEILTLSTHSGMHHYTARPSKGVRGSLHDRAIHQCQEAADLHRQRKMLASRWVEKHCHEQGQYCLCSSEIGCASHRTLPWCLSHSALQAFRMRTRTSG